jgi:hypothetical protein
VCVPGQVVVDMFGFDKNKERERYYLLAGMGGKAARRKHRWMMKWALATGIVVSIVLGVAMYFIQRYGH